MRAKPSFFDKLFSGVWGGAAELRSEKARLEAFLNAFPGEYCGFSRDGSVAYSAGFAKILDLEGVSEPGDIQSRLSINDAPSFENLFARLKGDGIPFTLSVQNFDERKHLKLTGTRGVCLEGEDYYLVLWAEDITAQVLAHEEHMESLDAAEAEQEEVEVEADPIFTRAIDVLVSPAWLRDKDQKITWVNDAYSKALNMPVQDIIEGQREFAPPPKKKPESGFQSGPELARQADYTGMPQSIDTHIICRGKRLLMKIHEIPLVCENGSDHEGTIGFAQDITAQDELLDKLKRYEATNRELLGQLSTAIAIFNTDKQLEFYNSGFAQLWGLEEGWLNKKPKLGDIMEKLRELRRLPEQADFRSFKQSWLDMFTGVIDSHEDMLYLPDNSALRMVVVPQSAGGLMMTFEDVTSRLELESSYNTLIAVQRETLDNLAEAVAVYGGDGRLKLWNPSYSRMWDLNPEDLDGDPHISQLIEKKKKFFTDEDWPARKEDLLAMTLDRSMREGRLERANQSLIDYSAVPLPDGGVLLSFTDVTDTVRVENALRDKNQALEAAEKLKLDFLANVSYQLRTPLSAIMGFNDMLDQEIFGSLNDKQKEYTHDINEASNRLLGLINDILDLSTIEAGYMVLEQAGVKIKLMLESLVDLTAEWAHKEKVSVSLTCADNIGAFDVDERRMKQALMNLIRNSITFTPSGGSIEIKAKRYKSEDKRGIEIAVSDTGIGIARENQLRVFQPFERAQRGLAHAAEKGTNAGAGLGLSLVRNIVALHGGTVAMESKPGEGTEVTLFFPQAEKQQAFKQKVKLNLGG